MNEIHLSTVDSTQSYAKQHAATFPPDQITCITAEEQTAGRGRFHHTWISPPGVNLYITFFFQLPPQTLHLSNLGQLLAISFTTLLLNAHLHPKIKWPNDIQLNSKKIAGILCEIRSSHIFLGIGINVNIQSFHGIEQPATSLFCETGTMWDRNALLHDLQQQFLTDLTTFKQHGFAPFQSQLEHRLISPPPTKIR